MNLTDVENYVDPVILQRGICYYEDGAVLSLKQTEKNLFEANVEGTEVYLVEVELDDNNEIVYSVCDCPYNWGEYCKHQVAVFLTLRDIRNGKKNAELERTNQTKNDYIFNKSDRSIMTSQKKVDYRKALSAFTKDELINMLASMANEYKEIGKRIELSLCAESDEEEIKKSVELIRVNVHEYSDENGFIEYYDAFRVIKGAKTVLDNAKWAVERGKRVHALSLTLCVVREMFDAQDCADDSDGMINGVIDDGVALIDSLIKDEMLSEDEKETVFHMLLKEAADRRYDEFMCLYLYERCLWLAEWKELQKELDDRLGQLVARQKDGYYIEECNLLRYRLIEKFDDPTVANKFIEQNIRYAKFRTIAIETAISNKEYERAEKYAREGEEQDKDRFNMVESWRKFRYKIYQLTGQLDELRKLAMTFILNGHFDYYLELKNTYENTEWPGVYPEIIHLIEQNKAVSFPIYTSILIEEGEKMKLLKYVKTYVSEINRFYRELIPEYKDEVYEIFCKYIELMAQRANSRRGYQNVCAIIRNLKKAGGREQASNITKALIEKYPRRPAFRDELSRV